MSLDATLIGFQPLFPSQLVVGGTTTPGEIRISHSGTGTAQVHGKLDARESGVVEVLAPNGDLTASGKFFAGPAGCIGVSAGGVLDTSGLANDVPLATSCP